MLPAIYIISNKTNPTPNRYKIGITEGGSCEIEDEDIISYMDIKINYFYKMESAYVALEEFLSLHNKKRIDKSEWFSMRLDRMTDSLFSIISKLGSKSETVLYILSNDGINYDNDPDNESDNYKVGSFNGTMDELEIKYIDQVPDHKIHHFIYVNNADLVKNHFLALNSDHRQSNRHGDGSDWISLPLKDILKDIYYIIAQNKTIIVQHIAILDDVTRVTDFRNYYITAATITPGQMFVLPDGIAISSVDTATARFK